jgi:flagellin
MAGTYGDGTKGSAAEAFEEKLKSIEGLDQSSVASTGEITVKSNDGTDVNIRDAAGGTSAFAVSAQGINNNSTHGEITLYSENNINVETTSGAKDTLGFKDGSIKTNESDISLESIDVTTREGAELAIKIADEALKKIDSVRSEIGSTQNQLESTVRNISVTQVNVTSAESQIRDVDFALESANLKKHSILAQAGTYALSQANAAQQNVSSLLR